MLYRGIDIEYLYEKTSHLEEKIKPLVGKDDDEFMNQGNIKNAYIKRK